MLSTQPLFRFDYGCLPPSAVNFIIFYQILIKQYADRYLNLGEVVLFADFNNIKSLCAHVIAIIHLLTRKWPTYLIESRVHAQFKFVKETISPMPPIIRFTWRNSF